ncbi:MAG: Nal1-like putative serine protease [Candidatus Aminicenantales bacterium]
MPEKRETVRGTAYRLSVLLSLAILAAACGASNDNGGTPPPTTSKVTIAPASATVPRGGIQQFRATVADSTDETVVWKVNGVRGGEFAHGMISREGVYVAPTIVPNPATVTITATALADSTKSGTATVTLQMGSSVRVAIAGSGSRVTVPTFGSHPFSVTVTGTSNTAVTWKVNGITGGSATTGTISQAGLYYAPHSVPVSTAPNNEGNTTEVLVTAVSQADQTASDAIIVVPTPLQTARFPAPVPLGTTGGNALDISTSGGVNYCCSGTIGSLVSRGGKLYILSNNHVLARSDLAAVGEDIIQPGLVDNNCSPAGTVTAATLSQFFNLENDPRPNVDAALAEIVPGAVDPLGTIVQLGGTAFGGQPTDGTPNPGSGVAPTIGRKVAKSGAATGLTCGTILSIDATTNVEYQKGCNSGSTYVCDFTNQIVLSDVGFSAHGDSGSLVVTQDTADPVGLLFSGSSTDTVASPVSVIMQQLSDKESGEQFVFAGDSSVGPHAVAACAILQQTPAQAFGMEGVILASEDRQAAVHTRDAHVDELLGRAEILAIGVGLSYDRPGQPAILVFVGRGTPPGDLPAAVDGIGTRVIEVDAMRSRGLLTKVESDQAERLGDPPRFAQPISESEVERARAVHRARAAGLMQQHGVQGVGISSSADAPGEAALIIFVIKGAPRDRIPPVIDGLRTRVRETARFRAK